MFYPPFGTKQVEIFLFIKRKSAILIFKNRNCAFLFQKIYGQKIADLITTGAAIDFVIPDIDR